MLDVLLTKLKWQSAWDYLDDIIIFLGVSDKANRPVQQVQTLSNDAGVTIILKNGNSLQTASALSAMLVTKGASSCCLERLTQWVDFNIQIA